MDISAGREKSILNELRTAFRPIAPMAGEDIRYDVEERLALHDCPAISLALIRNGMIEGSAAYGFADRDGKRAANADTMFQAASMSKPLAATLAIQLVQQGLVSLDEDINRYLTSWQAPTKAEWPPVSLRGLLSHRAGANTVRFANLHPAAEHPSTIDVLQGRFPAVNAPLAFDGPQGVREQYSNAGTMLVQLLIEDVCGDAFDTVAKERIFDVLGMSRSTFTQPLASDLRASAAIGYERGRTMDGVWCYLPQAAAAGLLTTPSDYARFLVAFRNAALGQDDRILGQRAAKFMLDPQGGEFGLGWMVSGQKSLVRFGHTGSNQGFRCVSSLSLSVGDGLVAMTNADTGKQVYREAVHGLAALCDWADLKPEAHIPRPWSASLVKSLEGSYRFLGVDAPPFRLAWNGGSMLRRALGDGPAGQIYCMVSDVLLVCRDSIFSLEISQREGDRVSQMIVHESGNGEIARVERMGA